MFCRNNEDHDLQAKNRLEIEREGAEASHSLDVESVLGLRYDFMDRYGSPCIGGYSLKWEGHSLALLALSLHSLVLRLPPSSTPPTPTLALPPRSGSDRGNRRSNRVKGESEMKSEGRGEGG